MENRIILQLIKKDVEELGLLVDAMLAEQTIGDAIIHISTAKAQTLLNEFKMLNSGAVAAQVVVAQKSIVADIQHEKLYKEEIVPEIEAFVKAEQLKPEPLPVAAPKHEPEPLPVAEPEPLPVAAPVAAPAPIVEEVNTVEELILAANEILEEKTLQVERNQAFEQVPTLVETIQVQTETVDILQTVADEDPNAKPDKKLLGDSFIKEPSLHDVLSSNNNHQAKVKARPVTSLKGAIGLNDRFLYIRELFLNDSSKFEKSIQTLDQMGSFADAVTFLEQNFVWKKTETSLKFIDLLKRRFEN